MLLALAGHESLKSTHWSGRSPFGWNGLEAGHPREHLLSVPSLQCVDLKVEGFAPSLGVTIDL